MSPARTQIRATKESSISKAPSSQSSGTQKRAAEERFVSKLPSSQSQVRNSAPTMTFSKKMSLSDKRTAITQTGSSLVKAKAAHPSAFSSRTSGSTKSSLSSRYVSGLSKFRIQTHTSAASKPSASAKLPQTSKSFKSLKKPASGTRKRAMSMKSSTSTKLPTDNKSHKRSVAKTDAAIPSTSMKHSTISRKNSTIVPKPSSKKTQSSIVIDTASSAKSGLTSKSLARSIRRNSTVRDKSVTNAVVPFNKSEAAKKLPAVKKASSNSKGKAILTHSAAKPVNQVAFAVQPPLVVVAPCPVVVQPHTETRTACQYCCCSIRDVRVMEIHDRGCFDCSTRRH